MTFKAVEKGRTNVFSESMEEVYKTILENSKKKKDPLAFLKSKIQQHERNY